MIRALILDFDGLILDTETALIDAYADVHAAHGVPFDRRHLLGAVGHATVGFDPWQAFPRPVDREQLEAERRVRNRERDLALPVLPGVLALLDDARTRGLQVGLASNSVRAHCEGHLERLGLLERFAFLACRGETPAPKPEPDLYRRVLQQFGLRGHEAIAFEDSQTGVLAARRANLHVVAVPGATTGHHDFRRADLVLASLADCPLADLMARFAPAG